ncbi:hypothetical protein [Bordetella petrii]|uniref:hypothetical protein n=1 Tax=Bordetella petrii TaxID=94624 RepID=UPI001E2882E7|nr:hypothetical protein [Bordetella petrii]
MQLLECPVTFRLSAETHRKYYLAAKQQGTDLSKYLRARLETEDAIAEQVSQLRLSLMDPAVEQGEGAELGPMLLELLLLARRTSPPADLRAVHLELERQGIPRWTPDRPQALPE